jgi:uncharacterized surface protein with fasciclin (FAS1) repeats
MTSARTFTTALATGALALSLAACGGGSDDTAQAETDAPSSSPSSSAPMTDSAAMGEPFGPGCASVPATCAGSFQGMATAPVATAASANPVLSTLVSAVQAAGLVDTLNTAEDITVFAPSNDAFAKIDQATLDAVLADQELLTQILTLHVVPDEQLDAGALAELDSVPTVNGQEISIDAQEDSVTVNGQASVICANVTTANATVHVIDTVLMPEAM